MNLQGFISPQISTSITKRLIQTPQKIPNNYALSSTLKEVWLYIKLKTNSAKNLFISRALILFSLGR